MGLQKPDAKTRLLLMLWASGEDSIPKGKLLQKVKRSAEKSGDFDPIFEGLVEQNAIKTEKAGQSFRVRLGDRGLNVLQDGLNNPNFNFPGSVVSSRLANALLQWHRQSASTAVPKTPEKAILSYDAFKAAALEVYDRLNKDYHLEHLVPIYQIRRGLGDRVSRSQFDDWMLEMQADDLLQLQGGSLPADQSNPETLADSITTELSGLRCYAKRL
ncbi:hypothetical protein E1H12_07960 [Geitlerinema sp. P-1104]|uniref:hypothetical protein n=1 Tax=Geitlerinema sp. P-1104 TaxID=2546230 RepID=UPI001476DC39|nr:hypothetical protein [Geitlerinema sp. P-1104]NMG58461.1 hypothetical protein [Geitlerinema sp. P-1104]